MNHRLIIVGMTIIGMGSVLPLLVAAADESGKYQCTYGDLQRRVEIAHEPGVEVPCSVHYYKDSEMPGEQQVLWSADRDPTYCRTKAKELVEKLEGWGWDCGQDGLSGEDADPEAADALNDDVENQADADQSEEMLGDPELQ